MLTLNASYGTRMTYLEALERRQLLSAALGGFATQTNLVSDGFVAAAHTDADLKNPWGIAFTPDAEFWVSDNNAGVTTLYDGNGVKQSLVVTIPGAGGQDGTPTGQVYVGGSGFAVHGSGGTGASDFVFVGEDGIISGWSPSVDATNALVAVDNSASGAVYKGATLGQVKGHSDLFVANFNSGAIEVYNSNFSRVQLSSKAFQDKTIPQGFAPFNVQNVGGQLFVTYAKQDAAKHDDVGGAGNGYVDVFNTSGKLIRRLQHGSFLDSPWGVAKAPTSWGKIAGDTLVGQFKSGQIDVFSKTGRFISALSDQSGQPIVNDRLWALSPGSGSSTSSPQTLYFTAGVNDENDGLFASLTFSTTKSKPAQGGGGGTPYMI
jgi:uncharacterized protein (TIGR03118 family)